MTTDTEIIEMMARVQTVLQHGWKPSKEAEPINQWFIRLTDDKALTGMPTFTRGNTFIEALYAAHRKKLPAKYATKVDRNEDLFGDDEEEPNSDLF